VPRDAPCVARDAVDRCELIEPVRDDARLIASELVTNAVLHSGCGAEDTIEVQASLSSDGVVISVTDPCLLGDVPEVRPGGDPRCGGFGLRVVQQLARRWGFERPGGQRVWAELPLRSRPA